MLFFLGLHLQHVEVPRLGAESKQQLSAYATATATPNPSQVCDLHHSSWQRQILNPLNKARDWTRILMDASWVCERLTHEGNSLKQFKKKRKEKKRNLTLKQHKMQISSSILMYTLAYLMHTCWAHLMCPALSLVQGRSWTRPRRPLGAQGLQDGERARRKALQLCVPPHLPGKIASLLQGDAQGELAASVASPVQNLKRSWRPWGYSFAWTVYPNGPW